MASTIRLWHRILVDRIAESRWLRGRSGKDAAWFHYERHARVSARTAARQAAATSRARALAAGQHEKARARAQRLAQHGTAQHGPARILPRWQAAVGRLVSRSHERQSR